MRWDKHQPIMFNLGRCLPCVSRESRLTLEWLTSGKSYYHQRGFLHRFLNSAAAFTLNTECQLASYWIWSDSVYVKAFIKCEQGMSESYWILSVCEVFYPCEEKSPMWSGKFSIVFWSVYGVMLSVYKKEGCLHLMCAVGLSRILRVFNEVGILTKYKILY